ncbi:glycosyl hydrolase family 62 protein [Coprinopsis cinerea AmutBmut pab1-1]|nr:glycosyl hydrolase family 62 protein [Coprinopsis cinerea AmutBmut pab1-1]
MKFQSLFVLLAVSLTASALPSPQVVKLPTPQCGGKGYTGPTTCSKPNHVCFYFNENYSECIHVTRVPMWTPKDSPRC